MDAYHLASSIVSLLAGNVGSTIDSAVLPELIRTGKEDGAESVRPLVAFFSWLSLFVAVAFCACLLIAPGILIRFFAGGFDDERIRMGAEMLWWLTPFAAAIMLRPMAELWATLQERYTLSSICATLFNFIAIPGLLLTIPLLGVYAVAFTMSVGHAAVLLLLLLLLRGIPVRFSFRRLRAARLLRIFRNTLYSMGIFFALSLFVVVDKYFASRLPGGSVAAISYAGTILTFLTVLASAPLRFFLARISALNVENDTAAQVIVSHSIVLALTYFFPIALFAASAAQSIVSFIYGWGNFDARSVGMTALAFAAYCIGFAFSLGTTLLSRYAQALQRLALLMLLSYLLVALNALLDWLFIGRWGLGGLALATSATQITGFVLYFFILMGPALLPFLWKCRFFQQLPPLALLVFATHRAQALGTLPQLLLTAAATLLYFFTVERLGLMVALPEHWRPTQLALYLARSVRPAGGKNE
jgi:Uncharacterized membrane protein, putative virulence factor